MRVGALDEAATAATAVGAAETDEVGPARRDPAPTVGPAGVHVSDGYVRVGALVKGGSPLVFVSGNAGTGKTTLIRYLRDALELRSVVLAPTGVAALNAGGATIHSFFHFPPRIQDPRDLRAPSDRKLFQKLELLVIDEVSMLRCDVLDCIDAVLRASRGSDRPFGGVQLLFIGDMFQLPPVVPRDEWEILRGRGYASPYFFSAFSLRSMSLVHVELDHVYRQTDPTFVSLLNRLRVAEDTEMAIEDLNDRCHGIDDAEHELTLACTNRVADQRNARAMDALDSPEYLLRGTIEGKLRLDKDRLPSPLELRLKIGAQVMFTRNDEQQRWVNGSLGVVREVTDDAVVVQLTGDERGVLRGAAGLVGDLRVRARCRRGAHRRVQGGRVPAVPADAGLGRHHPQEPGQDARQHPGRLRVGGVRSRAGVRGAEPVPVAGGHPPRRPLRVADVWCDPRIRRFYEALVAGQV